MEEENISAFAVLKKTPVKKVTPVPRKKNKRLANLQQSQKMSDSFGDSIIAMNLQHLNAAKKEVPAVVAKRKRAVKDVDALEINGNSKTNANKNVVVNGDGAEVSKGNKKAKVMPKDDESEANQMEVASNSKKVAQKAKKITAPKAKKATTGKFQIRLGTGAGKKTNKSAESKSELVPKGSSSNAILLNDETIDENGIPSDHSTPIAQKAQKKKKIGVSKLAKPVESKSRLSKSLSDDITPMLKSIKSEPDFTPFDHSVEVGQKFFEWIISPSKIDDFQSTYWERNPLLIQRKNPLYYSALLSIRDIDKMLRENYIEFTKNIDITSYRKGVRETHNPEGRALPPAVWDFYEEGCSIRILNPQTYIKSVYAMNADLQEYFHCMIGANVYLTPPNSQGFAPHYDDIEAFVLQIEGKKKWRIYKPRNPDEYLPRVSSPNFDPAVIGAPIMEVTLEAGDMLYFPRGTIHQAATVEGHHSLHITMSTYQKTAYVDLLEVMLPAMLQECANNDVEFRRGLPLNVWSSAGLVNCDHEHSGRDRLVQTVEKLLGKLCDEPRVDDAVDQLAKRFIHDALPPNLTKAEKMRTVYGEMIEKTANGRVVYKVLFDGDTRIRLLRANIMRLVNEDERLKLYFCSANSREYHEREMYVLELEAHDGVVIESLVQNYPEYRAIKELDRADSLKIETAISLIQDLFDRGIVMLENA